MNKTIEQIIQGREAEKGIDYSVLNQEEYAEMFYRFDRMNQIAGLIKNAVINVCGERQHLDSPYDKMINGIYDLVESTRLNLAARLATDIFPEGSKDRGNIISENKLAPQEKWEMAKQLHTKGVITLSEENSEQAAQRHTYDEIGKHLHGGDDYMHISDVEEAWKIDPDYFHLIKGGHLEGADGYIASLTGDIIWEGMKAGEDFRPNPKAIDAINTIYEHALSTLDDPRLFKREFELPNLLGALRKEAIDIVSATGIMPEGIDPKTLDPNNNTPATPLTQRFNDFITALENATHDIQIGTMSIGNGKDARGIAQMASAIYDTGLQRCITYDAHSLEDEIKTQDKGLAK